MQNLIEIFYFTNKSILNLIASPLYMLLVIFLYMLMYRKTTSFFLYIVNTILYTAIGILISYIGLALNIYISFNKYFLLLIPITLIFAIIKSRFVCLAYTGAILGVIALFIPEMYININQIIGIVALLHLLEGLLILTTCDYKPERVIVYEEQKLKLGYSIEKMWVIPFTILIGERSFELFPLFILIAFATSSKKNVNYEEIIFSGLELIIFSLTLIFIYISADTLLYMEIVGLIAMPVLHEFLVKLDRC